MTYEEIKTRLIKIESMLQSIQEPTYQVKAGISVQETTKKLVLLKEQLQNKLTILELGDKTAFVNGQATEYTDEKELVKLKDNQDVKSIKTASGKKLKEAEEEGIKFSTDETKTIAREVGRALAKALKTAGDELAHMAIKSLEENSFKIHVEFKKDISVKEYSFYIVEDTLHIVDSSYDRELVDVGVKPSGEAVISVDVLTNELMKYFKSMNETMSDKEFADAQQQDRLEDHPEKVMIKKIQALVAAEKKKKEVKESLNGQFDEKYAIEISVRDARQAQDRIFDVPFYAKAFSQGKLIQHGSNVYTTNDEELFYGLIDDLNGFEIIDRTDTDESVKEMDMNDPVLMKMRAAKMKASQPKPEKNINPDWDQVKGNSSKKATIIAILKAKRAEVMRDMEQEAEPEGGPIADKYGSVLNKIDAAINKALGKKPMGYDTAIGEDIDVGHQDDEPNMLLKDVYDIAQYAAKLHKALQKYDNFDGEVDFPQWWQKKIILSRDYISAASHYLEAEEKQPALDQLALEGTDTILKEYDRSFYRNNINPEGERTVYSFIQKLAKKYGYGEQEAAYLIKQVLTNKGLDEASNSTINEGDLENHYRIDGLVNVNFKADFLNAFMKLYADLTEEDPFKAEEVLKYLNGEMKMLLREKGMYEDTFNHKSLAEADGNWPKEVMSRHRDIIYKLVKVGKDRAKYELINKETGKTHEPGFRIFQSIEALEKDANNTIIPQGGRQSSQFESAPGYEHDCAASVVHEVYGHGICLEGKHTLIETEKGKGTVTHYDVFFKKGNKTIKSVPVNELKVITSETHTHSKKKK
tara:strand:- start:607 stop:3036 length:2430 start_codon:yes stop_codon:yes gene_type:complete